MCQKAMGHQYLGLAGVTPAEIVRVGPIYFHITFFARHLERRHEPFGQMCAVASPNGINVHWKVTYSQHLIPQARQSPRLNTRHYSAYRMTSSACTKKNN